MTGAGPVHAPGWLAHEGGLIVAVGGGEPPAGARHCGRGSIVIPGLVSAHTHLPLGLFRGCADDQPFLPWILEGLLPAIQATAPDSDVYARGAEASARELLRGGVTLIGDNFFRDDGIAAAAATGQRVAFFQEVFGSLAADEDTYWREVEPSLDAIEARHDGIAVGTSPHTPWTCPERTFRRVAARASARGRRLSFHLDESREEHDLFTRGEGPLAERLRARGLGRYRLGMTPAAAVYEMGGLGRGTVVAHAVHVTADDVALLACTGTAVAHCPRSNMKLAEGIAPVRAMLDAGVVVGLGVDSAASNSRLDMFEEMRTAIHAQRATSGSVGALTATTVLGMATRGGAEALGMGDKAGVLAPGRFADFVVLDASPARHQPIRDPVATVVHTCGPEDVAEVVIGGIGRHRRDA